MSNRERDDPDHSEREERDIIVGMSKKFRIVIVVFTERNGVIRIISARVAVRNERKNYEEKWRR
jgi:uncharacterized DUF497 family protein